jgi:hypothetical protein
MVHYCIRRKRSRSARGIEGNAYCSLLLRQQRKQNGENDWRQNKDDSQVLDDFPRDELGVG